MSKIATELEAKTMGGGEMKIQYVCVKSLGKWKKGLAIANFMLKLKTNNYG